jgi:hypothetical protein
MPLESHIPLLRVLFVGCATCVQLWEAAFFTHHEGITQAPLPFPTLSRLPRSRGNAEDVSSPHSTSPSPQVSLH